MNWQRGYKLSLLSQLPLFRMITTVQIYLGHFFFIKSQDCVFSCQKCPIAAAAMKSPGKCRAVPLTARSNPTPLLYAMPMTSAHKQGGLNHTFHNQKGSPLGFWGSNPNKTLWNKQRSRLTSHSTTGIHTIHTFSELVWHATGHSRSPSHCFLSPLKLSGWFVLAGPEFCYLSRPKDYQPRYTCRQDSTQQCQNTDLRLARCNIHCLYFQKLQCIKLRFQLEVFCTYKVRRFVRPLNTPSAMWLMRLSPRFSFSNKPSPTKADSLRRVSWLYDKSLETLNMHF